MFVYEETTAYSNTLKQTLILLFILHMLTGLCNNSELMIEANNWDTFHTVLHSKNAPLKFNCIKSYYIWPGGC